MRVGLSGFHEVDRGRKKPQNECPNHSRYPCTQRDQWKYHPLAQHSKGADDNPRFGFPYRYGNRTPIQTHQAERMVLLNPYPQRQNQKPSRQ
ncbi:hypothetical protein HanRHA438_Chr13g0590301 [Helianthus annuus]|nr:hypothetical protein HanRHA438_Chr13g0590301 [Helianthus annuus]